MSKTTVVKTTEYDDEGRVVKTTETTTTETVAPYEPYQWQTLPYLPYLPYTKGDYVVTNTARLSEAATS